MFCNNQHLLHQHLLHQHLLHQHLLHQHLLHQKHLIIRRQNIYSRIFRNNQFKYISIFIQRVFRNKHQTFNQHIYSRNVLRYSMKFRILFRYFLLIVRTSQLQDFNRRKMFQIWTSLQFSIRKVSIDCLLWTLQILRICRKMKSKLFFSSWKFMKRTRSEIISMFFDYIVFNWFEKTNEIDRNETSKSRTNSHCKEMNRNICMQTLFCQIVKFVLEII